MSATAVRRPAVAGLFYPDEARRLRADLGALLDSAPLPEAGCGLPKAIVVPHAGYVYSGAVAAAAYAALRAGGEPWRRVVLIGPSHRVGFPGLAVPTVDAFETPLGSVPIDHDLRRRVLEHPAVVASDHAHALEHSLEVQLPFLQVVCHGVTLLPLVAGDADARIVAEVLDLVWGGDDTGLVISTDLSHYHACDRARRLDAETARRIVAFDATLHGEDACGCVGLNGFLVAARRHHLAGRVLRVANSGDAAGDRRRVVGYGAFAFDPAEPSMAGRGVSHA